MSQNPAQDPQRQMSDEDFKHVVGKPEFLQCAKKAVLGGYMQDHEGTWWAFYGNSENSFYGEDGSARLRITGDVIEVAIRSRWADEPESGTIQPGETPVMAGRHWEAMTGITRSCGPQGSMDWASAVKLPFKPRELRFVDA